MQVFKFIAHHLIEEVKLVFAIIKQFYRLAVCLSENLLKLLFLLAIPKYAHQSLLQMSNLVHVNN